MKHWQFALFIGWLAVGSASAWAEESTLIIPAQCVPELEDAYRSGVGGYEELWQSLFVKFLSRGVVRVYADGEVCAFVLLGEAALAMVRPLTIPVPIELIRWLPLAFAQGKAPGWFEEWQRTGCATLGENPSLIRRVCKGQ